jgi:hypothetical protein
LMDFLTMFARPFLPTDYGTFIQMESGYNRLNRTAVRQQSDDKDKDALGFVQAIKRCPFRLGERFLASIANVASLRLAVNSDVALAHLSSCRTGWIVAKYCLRVHWLAPSLIGLRKACQWTPFLSTGTLTTVY